MLATVCLRHRTIVPAGEPCASCAADAVARGAPRRARRNSELGRTSRHWRQLSFRLIARHRRTVGRVCPVCGRAETGENDDTKLTVDLVRGGSHETAREDECEVKCRRCHGSQQGARR